MSTTPTRTAEERAARLARLANRSPSGPPVRSARRRHPARGGRIVAATLSVSALIAGVTSLSVVELTSRGAGASTDVAGNDPTTNEGDDMSASPDAVTVPAVVVTEARPVATANATVPAPGADATIATDATSIATTVPQTAPPAPETTVAADTTVPADTTATPAPVAKRAKRPVCRGSHC